MTIQSIQLVNSNALAWLETFNNSGRTEIKFVNMNTTNKKKKYENAEPNTDAKRRKQGIHVM